MGHMFRLSDYPYNKPDKSYRRDFQLDPPAGWCDGCGAELYESGVTLCPQCRERKEWRLRMDWKREAADKLRDFEARKLALKNLPLERERVRSVMEGIRSAGVDGGPVKNGLNRREDRLLGCMVQLEELDRTEKQNRAWVNMVNTGLSVLTEEERLVLDRLVICPHPGNLDRVCQELAMERATVYRRRDAALRKFTLAMYGELEA